MRAKEGGVVYVLASSSMPELEKVGSTTLAAGQVVRPSTMDSHACAKLENDN
jgi:hypothetical protein